MTSQICTSCSVFNTTAGLSFPLSGEQDYLFKFYNNQSSWQSGRPDCGDVLDRGCMPAHKHREQFLPTASRFENGRATVRDNSLGTTSVIRCAPSAQSSGQVRYSLPRKKGEKKRRGFIEEKIDTLCHTPKETKRHMVSQVGFGSKSTSTRSRMVVSRVIASHSATVHGSEA